MASLGSGESTARVYDRTPEPVGERSHRDRTQGAEPRSSALLLLPLAAESREALRRQLMGAWSMLSKARTWQECSVLCQAMAERCSSAPQRVILQAESRQALLDQLARSQALEPSDATGQRPQLIFVCSGQGSQWLGMMRPLLAAEPAFRTVIEECDDLVQQRYGWSLLAELAADESRSHLDATDVSQLAIASIQLALGALWRAWGIVPDALLGHSLGEVTACGLAGILSLEDTLRVVGERAAVLRNGTQVPGGMVVVTLPEGRTSSGVLQLTRELDLAAYNSPNSLVLSGSVDAIQRLEPQLRAEGFKPERVSVRYASHCAHMDACMSPLQERLAGIAPRTGTLPVRGTSRENWLSGPSCGPEFWAQNLRNPVRFRQAIDAIVAEGSAIFVELSPHPLLLESIAQTLQAAAGHGLTLASCYRGDDDRRSMLATLATLHRAGFQANWQQVFGARANLAGLPLSSSALQELDLLFGERREPRL